MFDAVALRRVRGLSVRPRPSRARDRAIRTWRRSPPASLFFFTARAALLQGGFGLFVGAVPVVEGAVMALLLRRVAADRIGRASATWAGWRSSPAPRSAFATVAIPLQLNHQWITIGWALEGAALAWTYRRIPHRGLLYWSFALLAVVFVAAGVQPRGVRLRAARLSRLQLVPLHLHDLRRGDVPRRLVVRADRRSPRRRRCRARPSLLPAGRRHPAVPAAEHRDRRLLRDRPGDRVPLRRHARAGPDLHDRLAGVRDAAADQRHLPAQSPRPRRPRSR